MSKKNNKIDFGFQEVDIDSKTMMVEKVFNHEDKDIGISSFIERKNPDFKD